MPTTTGQQAEPKPLADVIRELESGVKRLLASGLNKRAVVVLLHDLTGIGKRDIDLVLTGLGTLVREYTIPARAGGGRVT